MDKIELYGSEILDNAIIHSNDYNFDYFAWRSLSEMYLLKNSKGKVIERPQHMYMRVAIWVTKTFEQAVEYYKSLSNQLISPATPIMINSGTKIPQLASCVLYYNNEDSRLGLLDTIKDISTYSADAPFPVYCVQCMDFGHRCPASNPAISRRMHRSITSILYSIEH